MATRYSKRRIDGSIGYYDSVEEMNADVYIPPPLFSFNIFFAVIGFFASLVIAGIVIFGFGVGHTLPKWARFISVFAAAGVGSYIIGRVGEALLIVLGYVILIAIAGSIISLVWHLA
ncbi:MAG: hypothetical protein FWD62_05235 [Betaproteobacteria bacterium]|nr:hypothetical protein [Betaproteobacteria bacterium]